MSYDYDEAGNRTRLQTAIPNASTGSTDTTVTTYRYDNLNRLQTVTDHHNQVTTYTYDDVGNRESVTYPNGTRTTYVYDELNRLETMQTVNAGNQIISQFDYTLYPTGHRQSMTDLAGTVTSYQYDELYRLTQETINHVTLGTVINSYDYDDVGNRTSATENGQTTTYTYDANDRMLTSTQNGITTSYTYDDNGNTLSQVDNSANAITSHFTYDARNKLVFVEQLENGAPTNSIDYQYDIDGNRTQKADNSGIVNFVVDRNQQYAQVIHETDDQNQIHVTYTHGDDLISQDRNATINYYNYDGLGSTRSLTDFLGQITDTYDYNAYGTILDQSGSTQNNFLYTGEQFDASLDNYYLRARYYDPAVGRFTQMDTWQGKLCTPITLNKYIYAGSDPANAIDPSGNSILLQFTIGDAINNYSKARSANIAFKNFNKIKKALCNVSTAGFKQAHHVWPVFLGGSRDGITVPLNTEFHRQFHQLLHYMLRFNGFAGGFGAGSSRASYEELFKADIKRREDAHKILLAAARIFDRACRNKGVKKLESVIKKQIRDGKWDF